jgi:hypothetical protein
MKNAQFGIANKHLEIADKLKGNEMTGNQFRMFWACLGNTTVQMPMWKQLLDPLD